MSTIEHPTSINRDYIRLLQVMRRFIRDEFAQDIRISHEDAAEQLLHFADRSRNHVLQEMGKELREFVQQQPIVDEESGTRVRYYRGAAVLISEKPQDTKHLAPVTQQSSPKRIYRGQIIGG